MAQPQFSTPSLQELVLNARSGADAGAGSIRAASEGFGQGAALVQQRRLAELKQQIAERGLALKEKTLDVEADLGQQRVDATLGQTEAAREGVRTRAKTAKAGQAGTENLRKAQAELARAKAKLIKDTGSPTGKQQKGQFPSDTEIEVGAEDDTNKAMKELALEVGSLREKQLRENIKSAKIESRQQARNRDIATFVGGTFDEELQEVLVFNENDEPGSIPPLEVVKWLKQNVKRKAR